MAETDDSSGGSVDEAGSRRRREGPATAAAAAENFVASTGAADTTEAAAAVAVADGAARPPPVPEEGGRPRGNREGRREEQEDEEEVACLNKSAKSIRVEGGVFDGASAAAAAGARSAVVNAASVGASAKGSVRRSSAPGTAARTSTAASDTGGGGGTGVPSPDELKLLGRKARESLRRELGRRPEVVRLESGDGGTASAPGAGGADGDGKPMALILAPSHPKRTRKRIRDRSRWRAVSSIGDGGSEWDAEKDAIDDWLPDMSSIIQPSNGSYSSDTIAGLDGNSKDNAMDKSAKKQWRLASKMERRRRCKGSNVVWLHGLPKRTTPQHIRRFFSGLDLKRILILPTAVAADNLPGDDYLLRFPQWDASPDGRIRCPGDGERQELQSRQHRQQPGRDSDSTDDDARIDEKDNPVIVERYDPHQMRVLVEFETAQIAAMAADRSGEVLKMIHHPCADCNSKEGKDTAAYGNKRVGGCRIGVTQVVKPAAKALVRIGIDAVSDVVPAYPVDKETARGRKDNEEDKQGHHYKSSSFAALSCRPGLTVPLETTLEAVERKLDRCARRVLWSGVSKDIELGRNGALELIGIPRESLDYGDDNVDAAFGERFGTHVLPSVVGLAKDKLVVPPALLVSKRKKLLADYERLLSDHPFLSSDALDSELVALDPLIRLTKRASHILHEEIRYFDEWVLQVHRWNHLVG